MSVLAGLLITAAAVSADSWKPAPATQLNAAARRFDALRVLCREEPSPERRIAALDELARYPNGEVLPTVRPLLNAESAAVRRKAVVTYAFCAAKQTDVWPNELVQMLHDDDLEVRRHAGYSIDFFAKVGSDSVPVLIALLDGQDEEMRSSAATALRRAGKAGRVALPRLKAALHDKNWLVSHNAAVSTWSLSRNATLVVPVLVRRMAAHPPNKQDGKNLEPAFEWLASAEFLRMISKQAPARVTDALVALLGDGESAVRNVAANWLAGMAEQDAASRNAVRRSGAKAALARLLDDDEVRSSAENAILRIEFPE